MNKKQNKDYYEGVLFICIVFIVAMLLNKATEFMLLLLNIIAMRFVALSRNDAKRGANE